MIRGMRITITTTTTMITISRMPSRGSAKGTQVDKDKQRSVEYLPPPTDRSHMHYSLTAHWPLRHPATAAGDLGWTAWEEGVILTCRRGAHAAEHAERSTPAYVSSKLTLLANTEAHCCLLELSPS